MTVPSTYYNGYSVFVLEVQVSIDLKDIRSWGFTSRAERNSKLFLGLPKHTTRNNLHIIIAFSKFSVKNSNTNIFCTYRFFFRLLFQKDSVIPIHSWVILTIYELATDVRDIFFPVCAATFWGLHLRLKLCVPFRCCCVHGDVGSTTTLPVKFVYFAWIDFCKTKMMKKCDEKKISENWIYREIVETFSR